MSALPSATPHSGPSDPYNHCPKKSPKRDSCITPLPLCLLKISTGLIRLEIVAGWSYRHGHDDDSLCRYFDLGLPFSQPRGARTQACRSSTSVGRSTPTAPRSTSAFIPGSTIMGVALPALAEGHRRNGIGQTHNRGRVASPGLPILLALAITSSGSAQDQPRNP